MLFFAFSSWFKFDDEKIGKLLKVILISMIDVDFFVGK